MENKFSIIMVCKNSEITIKQSIDSFFSQTYQNKEIIIIDGGSTDNTNNIIKEYKKIDYYESIIDLGLYASINYAIKKCKGNIIGLLHSDDTFYSKEILNNLNIEFNSNVDAVCSNIIFIDEFGANKRTWKSTGLDKNRFKNLIFPPHTGIFVKKKILEIIGPYDEKLKISSDQEFMYKLFYLNKFNIKYLDYYTIKMKLGGLSTKSIKSIILGNKETFNILNKYNKNIFINLFIIIRKLIFKIGQ